MKYYATKWCLTRGIVAFEGKVTQEKYVTEIPGVNGGERFFLRLDREAFDCRENAETNAKERAARDIKLRSVALVRAEARLRRFNAGNIKFEDLTEVK